MKDIGIVRNVDELGRIVIPMELRRSLGIQEKDPLEIHIEGEKIILTKHIFSCVFCGSSQNNRIFNKKQICEKCVQKLGAAKIDD